MNHRLPFVSIIVANYNGKDVIKSCLQSLERLNYPSYEIIVVDDASTDNSAQIIEEDFPKVKLLKLSKNLGLAGANNAGFNLARGDIIVFDLNNDEVVHEDWLTKLVGALVSSPDIGITCGKRYQLDKDFNRGDIILSAGSRMNPVTAECEPVGYGSKDSEEYSIPKESDFATVLVIKREVLQRIGLFDSAFRNYYEDSDLSIRAKKTGYKIFYVPHAKSWHIGASSFGKDSYRRYYFIRRNQIRFIIKNFAVRNMILGLLHCLFLKTLLDTAFAIRGIRRFSRRFLHSQTSGVLIYIPRGSISDTLNGQINAFAWNLKNLAATLQARRLSQMRISPPHSAHGPRDEGF